MKIFISFFLIFWIPSFLFAQQQIVGKIVDIKKNSIPYVSIGYYNHLIGSSSDNEGKFVMKKVIGDSIKFSMIGYLPQTLVINEHTDTINIELIENYSLLRSVTVQSRTGTKNKTILGHYNHKTTFDNLLALNLQEATFIPNTNHIRGFIDEVKFKLMDFRNKHFILRIRLYNRDPNTGMPFEDLLLTDNLIYPNELRHINIFSLKAKNIELPEDGVYISFEWVLENNRFNSEKTPYLLGNSSADRNYRYQNFKEIRWYPAILGLGSKGFEVLSIALTISY